MSNQRFARVTQGIDVGTDCTRSQKQFYRDRYCDAQMVNDNTESGTLATSEALSVSFDQLTTVYLLYIESDGPIQIAINGAATPGWTMQALPDACDQGGGGCDCPPVALARCTLEGAFTSLTVTNPSSTKTVDYTVYMCGT